MAASKQAQAGDVVQRPTGMATLSQFAELVTQVPVAQDSDGTEIIARILEADSLDKLAEDDGLPSSKDLAPFSCHVQAIARRASDHPSNTGFYLIVDGVTTHGEPIRFSAGGEQTIAMLAKLHQLGALPIQCSFETVTTKSGNTAVNCKPIPSTANGRRG
jgi:hypothetical protein